jgi:hypothetical protein
MLREATDRVSELRNRIILEERPLVDARSAGLAGAGGVILSLTATLGQRTLDLTLGGVGHAVVVGAYIASVPALLGSVACALIAQWPHAPLGDAGIERRLPGGKGMIGFPGMPTKAEIAELEQRAADAPSENNHRELAMYTELRRTYTEMVLAMTTELRRFASERWQRAGFVLLLVGLLCVSMQAVVPGLRAAGL